MIKDFEQLEKRCKKHLLVYRLTKWWWLIVLIIGGALTLWYTQIPQKSSLQPHSKTPSQPLTPNTSPNTHCYGLQFMDAHATKREKVEKYLQHLEKLGHKGCYIKKGDAIPNKNTHKLFLICDTRPNKNDLTPYIALAKEQKLSYLIVPSSCDKIAPPLPDIKKQKYQQALAKARFYYLQKDYANTQKWAMRANEIDKSRPEAWILYAKALWYQGKQKEAKELLRFFLRYKKSPQAQKVLQRMEQDRAP